MASSLDFMATGRNKLRTKDVLKFFSSFHSYKASVFKQNDHLVRSFPSFLNLLVQQTHRDTRTILICLSNIENVCLAI
jgi:hypothetical protein